MFDIHTHFFPKSVSKNHQSWATDKNELYWKNLVGERPDGKKSLQGFPSEEKFIADMNLANIERAVIQGWYWQNSATCIEQNAQIMHFVKKHPDRLLAFASVQPAQKDAIDIVKSARENGFCGLGELHDGVQQFSYKSKIFEKILEIAEADNLAICLHITEHTKRQYLGKTPTNTQDAIDIAKQCKGVNFIFAHWCGNLAFENQELFANTDNIFFDCAASQFTAPKDVFQTASNSQLLENKVIYGTDYPLRLYPKLFEKEEMQTAVKFAKETASKKFAKNLFTNNFFKVIK